MRFRNLAFGAAALLVATLVAYAASPRPGQSKKDGTTLHDFVVKDIEGRDVSLRKFRGKVVLVVNVASQCGNTPQYAGLEKLYRRYQERGLVVAGFPSNDFGAQEPGTNEEIKEFCESKFGVTFPMFSKISVKGIDIDPLYQWLIGSVEPREDVDWNFAKFLVGRDGRVIARFSSRTKPDDQILTTAILKALAEPK
ncbi:MAG: glutathione peroxidase [Fimbriimonadaceae bacterium]|nr:glutathione peroxidase [Fimbriimonadaceae bacterium]